MQPSHHSHRARILYEAWKSIGQSEGCFFWQVNAYAARGTEWQARGSRRKAHRPERIDLAVRLFLARFDVYEKEALKCN